MKLHACLILYLKADVVSSELRSKDGKRVAIGSPAGGIRGVVPFNDCIQIPLPLNYQFCFVGLHDYLLPVI